MRDYFWQRMENDHGDLADIVRAGGQSGLSSNAGVVHESAEDWLLPSSEPVFFSARDSTTAGLIPGSSFGDPFVNLGDPLLSPYGATAGQEFFDGAAVASSSSGGDGNGGERFLSAPRNGMLPEVHHPQICHGGFGASASSLDHMDHGGGVQTATSPRAPGIKRRKSPAKKVVCIPVPATGSNRTTGEVVPCDLWAWRKYGQKPIKGSPYPRGYYRCSSSKGCSARKQVERSRTDPNMLVITYTSEHNHPWPTQRNALAGSIRSHPSKTTSKGASNHDNAKSLKPKDEDPHESTTSSHRIKEEKEAATEISEEKTTSQRADHQGDNTNTHQNYRHMIPDQSDQPDDFFSDLAELEPDPISLIFSKAFLEAKADVEENKGDLDPFHMFD